MDITYGGMTVDRMDIGQVPLYVLLIMLLFDFVLYGLLAVYFDNVIPGEKWFKTLSLIQLAQPESE